MRLRNHRDSQATPLEDRAVGVRSVPANGNQSILRLSLKLRTIISPAADSGTAQDFFAGVRTKRRASAQWIRWSIAKVRPSRSCRGEKAPRFGSQRKR